jgi:hypothetical protein
MGVYLSDTDMELLSLDDDNLDAFIEQQLAENQEQERGHTESNS